jgi:predicted nuclease with RNAse H fold
MVALSFRSCALASDRAFRKYITCAIPLTSRGEPEGERRNSTRESICHPFARNSPLMGKTGWSVVGIDVGGLAKGFHAVALSEGEIIARFSTKDAHAMRKWACAHRAAAVGIDAPCCWGSADGRAAERALAAQGIRSFATPSRARAEATPFYHWMLNGAHLYRSLAGAYPLFAGKRPRGRVAFETFPHAIACALAGRHLAAHRKRSERRTVLEDAGIDTAPLPNIDCLDAALCALAASFFVAGEYRTYGEPASGLIVLPAPAGSVDVRCTPTSSLLP